MRRTLHAAPPAAAAAAAVAVAGCASPTAGSPVAASGMGTIALSAGNGSTGATAATSAGTSGATSAATSAASQPSAPSSAEPSAESSAQSPGGTSGGAPGSSDQQSGSAPDSSDASAGDGALDDTSTTWVTTFCDEFSTMAQYASPDSSGMGKQETVDLVSKAYHDMSSAAGKAAATLADTPPPTFSGGDALATGVHDWFEKVASIYGKGSTAIANGHYDTPDDLTSAIDAVESQVNDANQQLGDSVGKIDPAVATTIRQLPQCQVLFGGR